MTDRNKMLPEIRQVLKAKKLRWIFGVSATQLIPLLEISFMSSIYLILEPDMRETFVTSLKRISLDLSNLSEPGLITAVFAAGLFFLLLSVGLRYANEMNLINLRYFYYVADSQRLINHYLNTSTTLARKIGKEKIIDSIIRDCGTFADNIKLTLDILGAVCSMLLYFAGAIFLSWKMLIIACMVYALPLWVNRKVFRKMQDIGQLKLRTQEKVLRFFSDILVCRNPP